MQKRRRLFALISVFALLAGPAFAQEGVNKSRSTTLPAAGSSPEAGRGPAAGREIQLTDLPAQTRPQRRPAFSLMPYFSITPMAAAPNLPVLGGGTIGRLTKWTGFSSSSSFVGDSTIFESKEGLVGVGTDSPTSKLTVAGVVQSTSGGFKFPDGTVQTTVGVAATDVVKSLNWLKGDVQIAAGSNITITPAGNTLTVAAPNALTTVAHDQSLTGDGTAGNPLRVAQSSQPPPEPVSITARFTIEAGKSLGGAPLLTVPAGKRLTVEHGSGSCSTPPGQFVWQFELTAFTGGTSNPTQIIVPTFVGSDPAHGSFFSASLPVKLYASAGSEVQVQAWRGTVVTNDCYCTFHLTGVLTDQP